MKIDTTPQITITYAQLEAVLHQLGYIKQQTDDFVAFHEASSDTLLLFPITTADAEVPVHHLQMARVNSTQRGVTDEATFDRLLAEVSGGGAVSLAA